MGLHLLNLHLELAVVGHEVLALLFTLLYFPLDEVDFLLLGPNLCLEVLQTADERHVGPAFLVAASMQVSVFLFVFLLHALEVLQLLKKSLQLGAQVVNFAFLGGYSLVLLVRFVFLRLDGPLKILGVGARLVEFLLQGTNLVLQHIALALGVLAGLVQAFDFSQVLLVPFFQTVKFLVQVRSRLR